MADQDKQATPSSVFISYSRKEKEFVHKLNDALDNSGIEAWVDWDEDVAFDPSSDWFVTVARKNVQFWDVHKITAIKTDELVSVACSRITTNLSETLWIQLFFTDPYHLIYPDLPVGN